MSRDEWLAQRFEDNRDHLRTVAYRMLGSVAEADDAVQETWLRLSRSDTSAVENLGGWLTTVVARVCLDMLRSRKSRREESLDAQVLEPAADGSEGLDPEREVLLADSVGLALLVVLEMLALVNGAPGAVWAPGGKPRVVFSFTIADGRIVGIELLADPGRLAQLDLTILRV